MAEARSLLAAPDFNPRQTIILNQLPDIELNGQTPTDATTIVTEFKPEGFTISIHTSQNAIMSIAQPDYPGWKATLDSQSIPILRAYGALAAVAVPAGDHTVQFTYDPLTYRIGAIISLLTWVAIIILGLVLLVRNRKRHARS